MFHCLNWDPPAFPSSPQGLGDPVDTVWLEAIGKPGCFTGNVDFGTPGFTWFVFGD